MSIRIIAVLLISFGAFAANNGFAEDVKAPSILTESFAIPAEPGDFGQHGYYTFRHDMRLCVAPVCGGLFVKAVNRNLTRCPDGSLQKECYIASVSNKSNLDLGKAVLLQGRVKAKIYPGFGNFGIFELKSAYSSATSAAGKGLFVGLENNGIVCITSPCFSYDQYVLNRNKFRAISGLDLDGVGAAQEAVNEAMAIVADGGVLLAAGYNKQAQELAGPGITFVANQFYLPIRP